MERGDIYLVSLDPTAGHEQQGTRPVLINALQMLQTKRDSVPSKKHGNMPL